MDEIMSYCGLLCQTCPIYLATIEVDRTKKDKIKYDIVRMGKEHYGIEFKYEEINDCDGCKSNSGRLYFRCKDCKIRKCAIEKGIENCAYCDEYACADLKLMFDAEPGTKTRMEIIRKRNYLSGEMI